MPTPQKGWAYMCSLLVKFLIYAISVGDICWFARNMVVVVIGLVSVDKTLTLLASHTN